MVLVGLFIILAMVLALPFLVKKVEEELEIFLFAMGCIALTLTAQWEIPLLKEAVTEPVKIALAVLVAGLLFQALQGPIAHHVNKIAVALGLKLFSCLVVVFLGIFSSVITAIIAALLLVEITACLKLDRRAELILVVLACYAIGLGAALTPIGEPLSTIIIAKLKAEPYHADFFFLWRQLWIFILPGIVGFGILGAVLMPARQDHKAHLHRVKNENIKDVLWRTGKVYLFVMALIFLGRGFKPVIDAFVSKLPWGGLYWLNIISAILDNATLAAAEIGQSMNLVQIKSATLGLLIAGGMLIPGNIPNIISAGKLKIRSTEWARFGVPLGAVVMAIYFLILLLLRPA